jgi:hypothetical protein
MRILEPGTADEHAGDWRSSGRGERERMETALTNKAHSPLQSEASGRQDRESDLVLTFSLCHSPSGDSCRTCLLYQGGEVRVRRLNVIRSAVG